MKRVFLILSIYIVGNALLLLGTEFKPTIPIIILQIISSRSLNTLYYTDLQLIISLFICIFLQVFVPLQYKTCRNIC